MDITNDRVCAPAVPRADADWLQRLIARLPRPFRFLGVGGFGLVTDLSLFTIGVAQGVDPLLARLISLPCATVVTWRLNRSVTFDRTGRHQGHEAVRYAIVTAAAQGTSYAVFAMLVLTALGALPQIALLAGAAAGAFVSYNGHRLFAFARLPTHRSPDEACARTRGHGRNPGPRLPMATQFPHSASLHAGYGTGYGTGGVPGGDTP